MAKQLDLESYTLLYPSILKMSKHFGKSFDEMQAILFEQNVIPGQINPSVYKSLKEKSLNKVAKYYGVSLSTIYKVAANQHLNKPLHNVSRLDLLKQVKNGMTANELSKYYEVSYDKMLKFLKDNKVLAKRRIIKVTTEKVHKLSNKGFSIKEISKKLGCTMANVRYHLNKDF